MRFYDVPVNQSVPTEANRGLTSYTVCVAASNLVMVVLQCRHGRQWKLVCMG
jgi:hypothetical protein